MDLMIEKFRSAGLEITQKQANQLNMLTEFMLEYNKKVNLTRITEPEAIIQKHYIDSILPLTMIEVPRGTNCADIGTGAGFPALPMKIYRPDLNFTLIDSLGKRITYLDLACEKIEISCVTLHARGEEAARKPEMREKFGFVTARAVAALNILCEYCLPLVKKEGIFAAMKGAEEETEQAKHAIRTLGGEIESLKKYCLPDGDRRTLILIRKIKETPEQYPRTSGAITKKPL